MIVMGSNCRSCSWSVCISESGLFKVTSMSLLLFFLFVSFCFLNAFLFLPILGVSGI